MSDVSSNPGDQKASSAKKLAYVKQKWEEYLKQFGDNETCMSSFFETVGLTLFVCPGCESLDVEKSNGSRTLRCRKCKEVVWVTAKTMFRRVRLPLVWFGALWLMANGVAFNANQLHIVAGVAYATAWKICKKLSLAISELETERGYSVSSACFNEIVFRRSRETPAREHPRHEGSEFSEANRPAQSDKIPQGLSADHALVFEQLTDEPCHFDELCRRISLPVSEIQGILMLLVINGFAQSLPGNQYLRQSKGSSDAPSEDDANPRVRALIEAFIKYIRETFHGVSRRYLQLYLDTHWCVTDRKRWSLGSLLKHCLDRGEISVHDINAYVSPAKVRLVEPLAA